MIRERAGRLFYRLSYAHGKPNWDTGRPPDALLDVVHDLRPGRFLDLGCGTGGAAVELAGLGWEVVGIDFVAAAIAKARRRAARAGVSADFRVGDVTRLESLHDARRFDLILDMGCYHGLSELGRERYAAGVAGVAAPGALFLLCGFRHTPSSWRVIGATGSGTADVGQRFAPWFTVEESGDVGGVRGFAGYRLQRRPAEVSPQPPRSSCAAAVSAPQARA
jgi:SAM-dependent methyltransferase